MLIQRLSSSQNPQSGRTHAAENRPLPVRLATTLLVAVALLIAAAPAGAQDQALSLVDESEQLGPGVRLDHDMTLEADGFVDRRVVTVDLSERAVSSDLLSAPSIAELAPISRQANAAGAVAGVNGDFSDVANSKAALGFEIQGGELRKSTDDYDYDYQTFGVNRDGVAELFNLALDASATWEGTTQPLSGFNETDVPADSIGAYTRAWGVHDRSLLTGAATETTEVWVAGGRVVRTPHPPEGGKLPGTTTALVGTGTGAEALRTLSDAEPVELSYALEPARELQFAIGTNALLVRDGVQRPDSETSQGAAGTSPAPRTAIGFTDGGTTLLLVTIDGPGGTGRGGVTLPKLASIMYGLGAETAVNIDGGGSSTMVARELGSPLATLRNVPSDGSERSVPNGVGVFVAPGSGEVEELLVSPEGDEARAFPGLRLRLGARAVDDNLTPVELERDDVRWRSNRGRITDRGVLRVPSGSSRAITVTARSGAERERTEVRVLGELDRIELSSGRLSIPDLDSPAKVEVTGRDSEGYSAAIEPADLELSYDESVIRIRPADGGGLTVEPLRGGATVVEIGAGGETAKLPVTVGVETVELYRFDHPDEAERWVPNGTAGRPKSLSVVPEGLKLTYDAQRNMGITKTPRETRIPAPGQPLRIRAYVNASVATEYANLAWYDADGVRNSRLIAGPSGPGRTALEWTLPSDTKFPISIAELQVIETSAPEQVAGEIVFESIEADLAPELELPPAEPLRPDPLISPDGSFSRRDEWTFATLSDVQFTAASPELTKVAIAALARIRRQRPDFVVLNGDIVDTGSAADLVLARETLEEGGCELIAAGEDLPEPSRRAVPCIYVPGNHESYNADGSQGTVDAWVGEFGAPFRALDHKGTRLIMLNSALGSFRASGFEQLPVLEAALDDAVVDRSVDNVLVFAHHPVDDPDEKKASQLGDRREVALVKKLLSDFRSASDKGVAMVGSHAQIVDTRREEGVPYQVLPSSGKAPYGTPDRGGFTGYVRWSLDDDADASEQWLTADVRAFAQEVRLDLPRSVRAGTSAPVGGSIVQPSGVEPGTRVVPLAYPMSVAWGGSQCLAIGGSAADARRAGKIAVLDPLTREITGLRAGRVRVTVSNESMRELTDEAASLAPVRASETVRVTGGTDGGRRRCAR